MLSATGNLFQVTKGLKYPVAENGRCTRGWVLNRIRPPRDSDRRAAGGLPCILCCSRRTALTGLLVSSVGYLEECFKR